jgi:hypothetical protein
MPKYKTIGEYINWLLRESKSKVWPLEAKGQRLHNYHTLLIRVAHEYPIPEVFE